MGATYGFVRSPSGELTLDIEDAERGLLMDLAGQIAEFVAPVPADPAADPLAALVGIDPLAEVPQDPALARLFPDAFTSDPESSAEFRRFTERGLREMKLEHATAVMQALERRDRVVRPEDVAAWLGFLNDTRLTLGTRLDIDEDPQAQVSALPKGDPRLGLFHLYDWLTFLQDTLVRALLPDPA